MKHFANAMCMLLLSLSAVTGFAQSTHSDKKNLFSNYPATISCTEAQLIHLFEAAQGQIVNISFENNFSIAGPVTSNEKKYSNLQTMVVKLPAFHNILFSLSKRTENNTSVFVGHLFNKDYADGYELKRSADGNYQFIKIETEKILPACAQ